MEFDPESIQRKGGDSNTKLENTLQIPAKVYTTQ
jgi:hypothetical protein